MMSARIDGGERCWVSLLFSRSVQHFVDIAEDHIATTLSTVYPSSIVVPMVVLYMMTFGCRKSLSQAPLAAVPTPGWKIKLRVLPGNLATG